MNKKILSLLFCVVVSLFISGCAEEKASIPETDSAPLPPQEIQKVQQPAPASSEEKPTAKEISTATEASTTEKATVKTQEFSRKELSLYLGVWMPALQGEGEQSLEEKEDLIALGANTVAFGVVIPYFPDGSLEQERVRESKDDARMLMRYYKEAGLAIVFSPEPIPANLEGEPTPVPATIRETLLKNYEEVILDLAKIAEEENVEVFSPMNEPDWKLGLERASSWGQEILPEVGKVFTGKVMWKGLTSDDSENIKKVDFLGYDIIGFTSFPWGGIANYKTNLQSFLTALQAKAAEDGVKELFVAEFGTYDPVGLPKRDEPKSIQYVFEEGKGKLQGFLVFDPPRGIGTPVKGSELENVVKEEFEKVK